MASKPDFIIVPGAWHGPDSFGPTTGILEKTGYTVHGVSLAASNGPPHIQTIDPDVALIKETLNKVLSSGKDAVLIYHSYGSVPGTEALSSYLTEGPKAGWGKVRRLIFCAAFLLPEGGSLIAALNNEPLPWFIIKGDQVDPEDPKTVFYNDIDDSTSAALISKLKTHSYRTFYSQLTVAPWKTIPSTYILCTLDNAIPIQAQEGMVGMAHSMAPESFDIVERVEAGHSPFISKPERTAEIFIKSAEK